PSAAEGSRIDFQAMLVSTYTFSMDVMKTAGLKAVLRTFGSNNGTTVTLTETTATGSGAADVTDMGSYWRVEITRSFTGSANSLVRLNPFGTEVGASGSMTYRRVQFEEKPFATPYIENTTSAQTTRPATTRCDIPWIGNLQPISADQQVTVSFEFDVAGFPLSGYQTLINNSGGGGSYLQVRVDTGGALSAYRRPTPSHAVNIQAKQRVKVCYRVNKNTCDFFVNGAKIASTVTGSPYSNGLPSLFCIGYSPTPSRCANGHLRKIDIWNTPLTDIQCQAASS
ncbi:phage head spike fiber domain-containing protein, partial [Aeromonas veronii]